MKLCTKKVYCPGCSRLVSCREEAVGNGVRVYCSRCGRPLWLWDSVSWRYIARNEQSQSERAAAAPTSAAP